MTDYLVPRVRDRRYTAGLATLNLVAAVVATVAVLITGGLGRVATLSLLGLYGVHAVASIVVAVGCWQDRSWGWLSGLAWYGLAIVAEFWLLTFSNGVLTGAALGAHVLLFALSIVVFGYLYDLRSFYLPDTVSGFSRRRSAVAGAMVAWFLVTIYVAGTAFPITWHRFGDLLISGLGLGSLYALGTIGFVLIYKITGVLNFSQGILVVLGAFSVVLFVDAGLSIPLTLLGVLVFAVVFGLALERSIFQHFVGESKLSIIIVTLALVNIIEGALLAIVGGRRFRGYPDGLALETVVLPLEFTIRGSFLLGIVLAAVTLGALLLFFKYTVFGSVLRASASDQVAAMVLGVSITQTIKVAWVISIGLTMISGVLLGISQGGANFGLTNVLILIFAAAIFGGLDNLQGAFVGSLVVGILQTFGSFYYAPIFGSGFDIVLPMLFLLSVIIIKPYGLWGTERIERL